MFLALASIFYVNGDSGLSYWFIIIAFLAAVFFPYYSRRMHINHYKKHIEENYGSRINKEVVLQLEHDRIDSKDDLSEGSLKLAGITEIVEVPTAIYLRVDTNSLILPKARISNLKEVMAVLQRVATNHNIPFREELDWHWK